MNDQGTSVQELELEITSNEFTIPEGLYDARLKTYVDEGLKPDRFNVGKMRHVVKLVWAVNVNGTVQEVWDFRTASMNKGSTLFKIATAALGGKPDGEKFKLSVLLDREVRLLIAPVTNPETGKTRNGIKEYLRATSNGNGNK